MHTTIMRPAPQRAKGYQKDHETTQLAGSIHSSPIGFSSNSKPAGPSYSRKQENGKYTKFINMDNSINSTKSASIANSQQQVLLQQKLQARHRFDKHAKTVLGRALETETTDRKERRTKMEREVLQQSQPRDDEKNTRILL